MASKDLVSEEVLQELTNKIQEIVNNYCWNLEYFTPTDIEGFFDGTQQEINYYSSLIKDDVVSKNFLHSSKQIADDIAQSILEANEYTDSLLKNISSIQLEWCATNLPTTGENNKIYILPVTSGSGSTTVNTLNIWNNTSNDWVSIGNLEIDITQFYNKSEIDTKMDLKANKTEVVANDKIVQTLDSATNSSDTILSTSGLQVEMDKKFEKSDILSIIQNTDNTKVFGAKVVYDTFNQKADKTNIYEIKNSNGKSEHIVIDLPAFNSISGKTTRLFISDNAPTIGLQIWNGNTLEKDLRTPVINPNHIFIDNKILTPVSANINFTNEDSSCYYMVVNGICYVNLWSMNITANLNVETLFNDLPTAKTSAQFILSDSIGSKTIGMGWISRGSRIIECNARLEVGTTKSQGYARFSYPIDESWIPS